MNFKTILFLIIMSLLSGMYISHQKMKEAFNNHIKDFEQDNHCLLNLTFIKNESDWISCLKDHDDKYLIEKNNMIDGSIVFKITSKEFILPYNFYYFNKISIKIEKTLIFTNQKLENDSFFILKKEKNKFIKSDFLTNKWNDL